jgi:small conductance mechanosensitive channel
MQDLINLANTYLVPFIWKMIGVIVVWVIGGWVIKLLLKLLARGLNKSKVEATLARYVEGGAWIVLRLLLIIAILGTLGIETTSFTALLAAVGIAIGVAWGGLLANFAAGVFLIFLRPFKVGDMITAAGVTGNVHEIGLFMTMVDTVDNIRVYLGNNSIFSSSIQNYTTNPYRRVDLTAQIAQTANTAEVIKNLRERVAQIPNVMPDPAPEVEVLQVTPAGPILAVRPWCHNNDYWQVYFDTNKVIADIMYL